MLILEKKLCISTIITSVLEKKKDVDQVINVM